MLSQLLRGLCVTQDSVQVYLLWQVFPGPCPLHCHRLTSVGGFPPQVPRVSKHRPRSSILSVYMSSSSLPQSVRSLHSLDLNIAWHLVGPQHIPDESRMHYGAGYYESMWENLLSPS